MGWFKKIFNREPTASQRRDSGLVWQKSDDGVTRDHAGALIYCAELELDGFHDWRLPSIEELEILANTSSAIPGFREHDYWTSTPGPQPETAYAYIGRRETMNRTNEYFVRAVRFSSNYTAQPIDSSGWSAAQVEFFDMLKRLVMYRVDPSSVPRHLVPHGIDIEQHANRLGASAVAVLRRMIEVHLGGKGRFRRSRVGNR